MVRSNLKKKNRKKILLLLGSAAIMKTLFRDLPILLSLYSDALRQSDLIN